MPPRRQTPRAAGCELWVLIMSTERSEAAVGPRADEAFSDDDNALELLWYSWWLSLGKMVSISVW